MVFNSDPSITMLLPEKLFVMTFETSTCGRGPGECMVMSSVKIGEKSLSKCLFHLM